MTANCALSPSNENLVCAGGGVHPPPLIPCSFTSPPSPVRWGASESTGTEKRPLLFRPRGLGWTALERARPSGAGSGAGGMVTPVLSFASPSLVVWQRCDHPSDVLGRNAHHQAPYGYCQVEIW
eukprot:CAMPEP_0174333600 /NCGR_PEP_ID=MMETSP0810-20121108/19289_1 /TAXON_ID=73025 ORGANISM="Eutreptiella gymnastica-like, Strain CCMP1594" /NCGR_SAMPLE_ID=MMETSP0810 /ASSEMBLY_ACC=CAM_ASM_000659 /LENGTH=123 /DNA_ID=CAMNT_0015450829 /DNA_START=907 /DNA_END=1275 /DNA_ORIENTATION=-